MNRVPTSTMWTVEELVWLGERLGQSVKEHGKADRAGIIREFNETFPSKDLNPNKIAGIYTRNGGDQAKFIAWCRKERQRQDKARVKGQELKKVSVLAPSTPKVRPIQTLPATAVPRLAQPRQVQKPVQKKLALPPEPPRAIPKTTPVSPREPPRPQTVVSSSPTLSPKPLKPAIPALVSLRTAALEASQKREPLRLDASHDAIIARALAGWDPYDPSMRSGPWVRAAIAVNATSTIRGHYTDANAVEARVGRMIADFLMNHGIDQEQAVNASVRVRNYKPRLN